MSILYNKPDGREPLPKDTRTDDEKLLDNEAAYWDNVGKDNDYGTYGNAVMNFPIFGGHYSANDATEFLGGIVSDFPRLVSNISKSFTGGNNTGEHKQKTRLKAQKDVAIDGGLMIAGAVTGGVSKAYINRTSFKAGNAIINNSRKFINKYRKILNKDEFYKFSSKSGKAKVAKKVEKVGKVIGTGVEIGENAAAANIRKIIKDSK